MSLLTLQRSVFKHYVPTHRVLKIRQYYSLSNKPCSLFTCGKKNEARWAISYLDHTEKKIGCQLLQGYRKEKKTGVVQE
jgi:hypothetical protein